MAEESIWEREEGQERLKKRGLDNVFPPLKSYLKSGANVLDVGCGPGSITLDVAGQVNPGGVVGIDPAQSSIEQAKALVEESKVNNVTFQVGDSYSLEFEDDTFDITYSHALFDWLREPKIALAEQRRVTKRGGWVIAGIGNWKYQMIYPPCPAMEKFNEAVSHLNDPSEEELFFNSAGSREAMAIFSQAGFKELKIEGYVSPMHCVYPGSEYFDERHELFKAVLDISGFLAQHHKKLIDIGVLDEETLLTAQKEIEEWHKHPHAFNMTAESMAAGRVE